MSESTSPAAGGTSNVNRSDTALLREARESLAKLWEEFMKHRE